MNARRWGRGTRKRMWLGLFGTGLGLTLLVPVVGIVAMLAGAVGLAIVLERELGIAAPAKRAETGRSAAVISLAGYRATRDRSSGDGRTAG